MSSNKGKDRNATSSGTATKSVNRLERFRGHRDEYFKNDENSPLLPEQKARFTGLRYFPENPDLAFTVELDREGVEHKVIQLGTTTGEARDYIPAGRVHVQIDGEPVRLMVYREVGRGRYFLPLRDATSGVETYIVGRYLDPQELPDGRVRVDFNYLYNSYCAYNDQFACPMPPLENQLTVPIRAGERSFVDGEEDGTGRAE